MAWAKNKGPFTHPSIVKLKQEEETLINASNSNGQEYICIKVQVYTDCFIFKLNFLLINFK